MCLHVWLSALAVLAALGDLAVSTSTELPQKSVVETAQVPPPSPSSWTTTNTCSSPRVQLVNSYSTTDSAILTAHATSTQLIIVCEPASDDLRAAAATAAEAHGQGEGQYSANFYNGPPLFFRLDDEVALRPLAVVAVNRLQASWKTSGIVAPAATFRLRIYAEQAAAQLRKGGSAHELGHVDVVRPPAARDPWLAGDTVALASAFVLAALAITSRAGVTS